MLSNDCAVLCLPHNYQTDINTLIYTLLYFGYDTTAISPQHMTHL